MYKIANISAVAILTMTAATAHASGLLGGGGGGINISPNLSIGNVSVGNNGSILGGSNNSFLSGNGGSVLSGNSGSVLGGSNNSVLGGSNNSVIGGATSVLSGSNNSVLGGAASVLSGSNNSVLGGSTLSGNKTSVLGGSGSILGGNKTNVLSGGTNNVLNRSVLSGTGNRTNVLNRSILGDNSRVLNRSVLGGNNANSRQRQVIRALPAEVPSPKLLRRKANAAKAVVGSGVVQKKANAVRRLKTTAPVTEIVRQKTNFVVGAKERTVAAALGKLTKVPTPTFVIRTVDDLKTGALAGGVDTVNPFAIVGGVKSKLAGADPIGNGIPDVAVPGLIGDGAGISVTGLVDRKIDTLKGLKGKISPDVALALANTVVSDLPGTDLVSGGIPDVAVPGIVSNVIDPVPAPGLFSRAVTTIDETVGSIPTVLLASIGDLTGGLLFGRDDGARNGGSGNGGTGNGGTGNDSAGNGGNGTGGGTGTGGGQIVVGPVAAGSGVIGGGSGGGVFLRGSIDPANGPVVVGNGASQPNAPIAVRGGVLDTIEAADSLGLAGKVCQQQV